MEELLEGLLEDGEEVYEFVLTGSYCLYNYIHRSDDIASDLEETLHRILDAGMDAQEIMGAEIPEQELEGDYITVDLGYVIPGQIVCVQPANPKIV